MKSTHACLIALTAGLALTAFLAGSDAQEKTAPPTQVPDPAQLNPLQRRLLLSAQLASDWLQRANRQNGRFLYGYLPALRMPMEGDNYVHQAQAAASLARAAGYFGEERWAAIARQAILTLLLETAIDPRDANVRYTALPNNLLNRGSTAGMLMTAIHELPEPAKDVLDQADQLSRYLHRQFRGDGALDLLEGAAATKEELDEAVSAFSGPALHGIILSHKHRPAAWKLEALRRARTHYLEVWRRHKHVAMVPEHTAAYAEAFAVTGEQTFADAVFEMNDWLLTQQYSKAGPRGKSWGGGFPVWESGKPRGGQPDFRSAQAANSLAEACRVARASRDFTRANNYREALENCLQFLLELQYSEANTQHFAPWYRATLVGGFHTSREDGNLRLEATSTAASALVGYLRYGMGS